MTEAEWEHITTVELKKYWPNYDLPPGKAVMFWYMFNFYSADTLIKSIQAYVRENPDDAMRPRALWTYLSNILRGAGGREDGLRDQYGHTPQEIKNIVKAVKESFHEPTRKWLAEHSYYSDEEIYEAWLKAEGYIREEPLSKAGPRWTTTPKSDSSETPQTCSEPTP